VPRYVEEKRRVGQKPDNLGEIFEKMIEWGATINGYVFKDFWIDIGKPAGYLKANHYVMGAEFGERVMVDPTAVVSPLAKLGKGPVIVRARAKIGANVVIQPFTEIGEGASIGRGSSVSASMIFPNAVVGRNCNLDECIIDAGKKVGNGTRVERHSIY
jgi:mannose-1-phosphate guanylyltransferase